MTPTTGWRPQRVEFMRLSGACQVRVRLYTESDFCLLFSVGLLDFGHFIAVDFPVLFEEARRGFSYFQQDSATTCSTSRVWFAGSVDVDRVVNIVGHVCWLVELATLAHNRMAMLTPSSNRGKTKPGGGIFDRFIWHDDFCDEVIQRKRLVTREGARLALSCLRLRHEETDLDDMVCRPSDPAPFLEKVCPH